MFMSKMLASDPEFAIDNLCSFLANNTTKTIMLMFFLNISVISDRLWN